MNLNKLHTLGIDIGSTTVKIAILDSENEVLFSDYERHFANIQETLSDLLGHFTNSVQFRFLLSLQEAEVLLSQNI